MPLDRKLTRDEAHACAKRLAGSVKPHRRFEAEVYVLTREEGGRHTPFFSNYRPQFFFRTTDVTGTVELQAGAEMVLPGDNAAFAVER